LLSIDRLELLPRSAFSALAFSQRGLPVRLAHRVKLYFRF